MKSKVKYLGIGKVVKKRVNRSTKGTRTLHRGEGPTKKFQTCLSFFLV